MCMTYKVIDTVEQYEELLAITDLEKRKNYFRYTMMEPFKEMWNLINVPIKAKQENGYDVIMATKMLGYADISNDKQIQQGLSILKETNAYTVADNTIKNCIENANKSGLKVNADEIKFGLYVANPDKLKLQKGYTGFGGIPGFITVNIYSNEYNLPKLPAVIAHEFHHNIRFSYISMLEPEWTFLKKFAPIAGVSLLFEVLQFIFAIVGTDITDFIGNTLGGIIGIAIYLVLRRLFKTKINKVLNVLASIGTACFTALLVLLILANS